MDDLGKMLGGLGSGSGTAIDPGSAIGSITSALQGEGGLDGIVGKLREGGLGDQVDSWISDRPNLPVDPSQLGNALGPDMLGRLSSNSGIDIGQLLPMLSSFLPQLIDRLTPDGGMPSGGMPDLGSLVGGLTGDGGNGGIDDALSGLGGMFGKRD